LETSEILTKNKASRESNYFQLALFHINDMMSLLRLDREWEERE
jgi:hypothetical protein